MRKHWRRGAAVGLCGLYAALTLTYGLVWQDEWTLGVHVTTHAPLKPRPWLNLAVALVERGRFDEARRVLDYTAALVADPTVTAAMPVVDVRDAERAVLANRLVLSRLTDRGPR